MEFNSILAELERQGNLRKLPGDKAADIIDFSSNDYLGIAENIELTNEFLQHLRLPYFCSSASRLLSSRQKDYYDLEAFLEKLYNRPTLLFNSGYHANTGILPALVADTKTLIIADKLIHASIIDGIILSRTDYRRFPHNDIKSLCKIIEKNYKDYDQFIVITEAIYSMDGDSAPLDALLELKREFPKVRLYLDEAHSFGIKGEKGLGLSMETNFPEEWDIIVCPLGKAAASMGAFVVCNNQIKEILINRSRSLIFSTAIPPLQVRWTHFVIERILEMNKERERLYQLSKQLCEILAPYNLRKDTRTLISHIQPLMVGDSHTTNYISQKLYNQGIKAMSIRRPTVAPGTERIRFSLSVSHSFDDLFKLNMALKSVL